MPQVDNSKLYELIDRTRLELKNDLIRLEGKFDGLEAGRLSKLEDKVNKQDTSIATAATKLAILGFIAASIVGAVVGVIIPRLIP
jgi:F0F1-type ATP synthase assembly protein I